MLCISRCKGERIHVGEEITIAVVKIVGNRVTIGIDAPKHIRVVRDEIRDVQPGTDAQQGGTE